MRKTVKQKWVKALRSGRYKQARGTLGRQLTNDQRSFCCLGVLCDLHAKEHNLQFSLRNETGKRPVLSYFGEECLLPKEVINWAGLKKGNPLIKGRLTQGGDVQSLAGLNDGLKLGFKEIAKAIEKDL
jgi:hypothetical protein